MTGSKYKTAKIRQKLFPTFTASRLGVKDGPVYFTFGTILLAQPFIGELEVVVPDESVWLFEGREWGRVAGCKNLILFL